MDQGAKTTLCKRGNLVFTPAIHTAFTNKFNPNKAVVVQHANKPSVQLRDSGSPAMPTNTIMTIWQRITINTVQVSAHVT